MRILLTEDRSPLGSELLKGLSGTHKVHTVPVGTALTNTDAIWSVVRETDAVVHTGQSLRLVGTDAEPDAEREMLVEATQGMHGLLDAATQAGVRRFVYCSTLDLFASIPDDRYISEQWRPDPGTEMATLSHHLAEQVTREFARERAVSVTILRLGHLLSQEHATTALTPDLLTPDLMWLDPRDAADAVECALQRDTSAQLNWQSRWSVYHICSQPPHPKFLLAAARSLGFEPQYNFASAWAGGDGRV
jgi:nucleoside-diphosphate-sugar epimerase